MKFGNGYAFWGFNGNDWECDYLKMADLNADCGFDCFEIGAGSLHDFTDEDVDALKNKAEERELYLSVNDGPSRDRDFASPDPIIREHALKWYEELLDKMARLGSYDLIGALYSFWPSDFKYIDKVEAWKNSIEGLKKLSEKAERLGITMSLEVLNRNETYILTDCAEAKEYINKIGSPYVKILLDTYHMNIEEDNMYDAIRLCGNDLGHFHVGECNRKLPGENNSINWPEIGKALRDIHYDGCVVMEPFEKRGGQVGNDIRVWRDLSKGATTAQMTEKIKRSLNYLKKCCLGE